MKASLLAIPALAIACASPASPPTKVPPVKPSNDPVPPVAAQKPHEIESPHGVRVDPYYWLRDDTRKDPAVLAYLEAEKAYAEAILAPVKSVEDTLFEEMKARVAQDDSTVPMLVDGYWRYTRYETGKQYPIYARKQGTLAAPEQIVLDANVLAQGKAFYAVGALAITRDGKLAAYVEDTVGRNQFALRVVDIATGKRTADTAENISTDLEWSNDGKTLFYVAKDPTTLREDRVFRLALGGTPELVYEEKDPEFSVGLDKTKSDAYVLVYAYAKTSSEVRLIDANAPTSADSGRKAAALRTLLPREPDHLYSADHLDGRWVIRTNKQAKNFRLVTVADGREGNVASWKDLVPHRPDVLVERFTVQQTYVAANVRSGGLRKIEVLPATGEKYVLDAPDPAYAMTMFDLQDPASTKLRFQYDSPTRPTSVFEIEVATKQRVLLKQDPVPTYDPEQYASEYLHATATDGTKVPISIVYKKSTKRDGTAPLLVYGYGSYGASMEPAFSLRVVSLLDRGWVYAIAHIRGGQEMGRSWYEDGKLMKKRNTFTDFIAVTEHLVATKYGARDHVFAIGGSAGGLLMGAVTNMRPDLYRGIVTAVPFVDVVTTMMDASIPLTTAEYVEWGNPADKAAYDYMLSYSPYDQIEAKAYPAIYCKTGLWDSQVQYYEPAKYVAKLRAMRTDKNPIVLDIDMKSGHGGASGRFDSLRDWARMYAFLILANERPDRRK